LTGVIGDTVGTAAAATVGIDEVGAAIATMTLSGISAEEAGTSLNRLLQALIKPSDALKKALHEVGYESGAQALQQDKLNVVLGKLNTLSKGHIETLLKWFPEIRAARGELALAANNGLTYARSVQAGADAQKGAGSLQRAFAEQSKAVSFQLKILVNDINAVGIVLGTKFLPYITSGINGLRSLGRDALPYAKDRVGDLGDALGNLRKSLEEAWNWTGDLVTGLGQIGGSAVLGGIAGITSGFAGLTGELSKYPVLVHTITAAFLLWGGIKAFDLLLTGAQALYLNGIVPLANSLVPLGTRLIAIYENTKRDAATGADDVTTWQFARFDDKSMNNIKVVNQALAEAKSHVKDAQDQLNRVTIGPTATRGFQNFLENATSTPNRIETARGAVKRYRDEVNKWSDEAAHFTHNTKAIGDATHLTNAEIVKSANSIGVDLTNATQKDIDKVVALAKGHKALAQSIDVAGVSRKQALSLTDDELQKLSDLQSDMAAYQSQMGLLGPIVVAGKDQSVTALKDLADSAKKYIDGVQQTFADYGDIIAGIGNKADLTNADISGFYALTQTAATNFLSDIKTAISEGLDPEFVSRALQAGPEKAGPLLHKIVSDHSGGLIKMVNDSEKSLEQINQAAVEAARLTNIAVSSHSKQTADDLSKAMKYDQLITTYGGQLTAQQLAKGLGVSVEDVKRIAAEYGFVIAAGINPVLTGVGAPPITATQRKVGRERAAAGGLAEGGFVSGPDTRRDSVAAMLMPGEVVVRRDSVQKFGASNLLDLNRGRVPSGWQVPGYAGGGFVTPADVPKPPDVSAYGDMVGRAGGAAMGREYQAVVDFVKKQGMAGVGPGTPAQAIAWMKAAITLTHVPMSWLGPLLHRAKLESNYNPRAINLWDSNARAGHPSEGWMQTIGPTFQHYMLPGHGNIWNPVDNAAAAIRYIQARYGSAFNLPKSGGYAQGGMVMPMHSYDRGGYLPPGLSLAYNGTRKPEAVGHAQPLYLTVKIGDESLDLKIDGAIAANNHQITVEARTR
jgi:hypothetical protein